MESAESDDVASDEFIDAKLTRAFGASILWSDGGGFDDQWEVGGFVCAVCRAASMTNLVGQLVVNLLIYLLLRFGY